MERLSYEYISALYTIDDFIHLLSGAGNDYDTTDNGVHASVQNWSDSALWAAVLTTYLKSDTALVLPNSIGHLYVRADDVAYIPYFGLYDFSQDAYTKFYPAYTAVEWRNKFPHTSFVMKAMFIHSTMMIWDSCGMIGWGKWIL